MTVEKRKVLGRGLETLLPGRPIPHAPTAPAAKPAAGETIQSVAVELIERNPYQTRLHVDPAALDELTESIKVSGVLQPLLLRPLEGGRYQLLAGERRWLASKAAGKSTVPAIVRPVSNEQAMEINIVENLQREDLNPMEEAHAYSRLSREFGLTQEEMARRIGKDRSSISNVMRLLKLPVQIQEMIQREEISFGHAKLLLGLTNESDILKLAGQIMALSLSVRQTEDVLAAMSQPPKAKAPERAVDPNVKEAERQLQQVLGCKVQISDHNGKGKIVIQYGSLEDFDRVMEVVKLQK